MCSRYDTIPACDRQTDRQTDGWTDGETDGIAVASTALAMRALWCAVKTKARFCCLLQHLAWKQRGSILISVLHKLVTYFDTYPLTYSPRPTQGK